MNSALKPIAAALGLCLVAVALPWACGDAPREAVECPAGEESCACKSGETCNGELVCHDGQCKSPSACAGQEDCDCYGNGTCNDGLQCEDGVCAPCPQGELSCPCGLNDNCAEGLTCEDGTCRDDTCEEAGTPGCACREDGSCESGARCQNDVCVACEAPGQMGCACGEDFKCKESLSCKDGICQDCAGQEGCGCKEDGSCNDGLTCNDTSVCEPCSPGKRGCGCAAEQSCDGDLTCQDEACVPCEGERAGQAGCVCKDSDCADGLYCGSMETCQPCEPGKPGCGCDDGSCDDGYTCRNDVCETCRPGIAGCPCEDGSCTDGSVCDASTDTCREPKRCDEIGCSAQQTCQPVQSGQDATCLKECRPGFEWDAASGTCERVDGASCEPMGADSIVDACAKVNRSCESTPDGAQCGSCLNGYIEKHRRCVQAPDCSALSCQSLNRVCEPGSGSMGPRCGECADGWVEDDQTGKCRRPKTCSELSCAPNETCDAGTNNEDATCKVEPCQPAKLPCTGEGETGQTHPVRTLSGQCLCETEPGYYTAIEQGFRTLPCDEDDDGWVRKDAAARITSMDPAIKANARCNLRMVDRFVLENEKGQTKTVSLGQSVPLYESERNDKPTPATPVSFNGGRALTGAEINSLTKGCFAASGPAADLNDNGVGDVGEWQGQTLSGMAMKFVKLYETYTKFSYFLALNRGWYEPPSGMSGPGTYHIREKSRLSPSDGAAKGDRVRLGYDSSEVGSYWRQCRRRPDQVVPASSRSNQIGVDFSRYAPSSGTTGQWDGMNHHSQFKCVQVVDKATYTKLQGQPRIDHPHKVTPAMLEGTHPTRKAMEGDLNVCKAQMGANGPVSGMRNPGEPVLACSVQSPTAGAVGWASIRYLHYTKKEDYKRGCVNACLGYTCPSPFDAPRDVMEVRDADNFGRCLQVCGHQTTSAYTQIDKKNGPSLNAGPAFSRKFSVRGEVPSDGTDRAAMTGTDPKTNNTYTVE